MEENTVSQDIKMESSSDNQDVTMTACHEDPAVPGMEPASEGEDSSYGSASSLFLHQAMEVTNTTTAATNNKKRVRWDSIQTREFALVVGDHPLCRDGLPMSLGWQHSDNSQSLQMLGKTLTKISERKQSYVFPKRLSYEERRQRLCNVSGLTEDEVKNDEIDLVVRTLEESWDCVTDDYSPPFDPTPLAEDGTHMMSAWGDPAYSDGSIADSNIDLGDFELTDFEWTD